MIGRTLAVLALAGVLAGCEDSGVSELQRRAFFSAKDLIQMDRAGGVFVEVHGVPWEGARPEEIAGTLRMPKGPARQVRFRLIPAGQGLIGSGNRLVLHFNPAGKPDSTADCRTQEPLPAGAPESGSFTVNASFCEGDDWIIRAFMQADVDQNDWLGYYLAMEELLGKMFPTR